MGSIYQITFLTGELIPSIDVNAKHIIIPISIYGDQNGLDVENREIISKCVLKAYFNEAGLDIDKSNVEAVLRFFQKNLRKINNTVIAIEEESYECYLTDK